MGLKVFDPPAGQGVRKKPILNIADWARQIKAGETAAIARAITLFESTSPAAQTLAQKLLAKIFTQTGTAKLLGITGPPGVGKSSLVDRLVGEHLNRNPGQKVACLLVDPTNQFTGGSILGDRVRFGEQRVLDPHVFIRSLAAGNRLGGLTHNIREAVAVLEAAGHDLIIIETVGIGQSEIEIVKVAQTVVLVCQPASGDSVQMLKSGVTEIGHILAVNKADLAALADEMYRTVSDSTSQHRDGWQPQVLKTSTQPNRRKSIADLYEAISRHWQFLSEGDRLAEKRSAYREAWVRELVDRRIIERIRAAHPVEEATHQVLSGARTAQSPYVLAGRIIDRAGIK